MTTGTLAVSDEMLRELAAGEGVCVRPVLHRVTDTQTGVSRLVPIRCGATREQVCPSCAQRNRRLRMQQCREGWHLDANSTSTSTRATSSRTTTPTRTTGLTPAPTSIRAIPVGWRGLADGSAPTRRRQDAPDLPRLPVAARTIGQKFTGGTGSAGGHPCSPP
jgi:hypothetical protein